ncbi:MAG: IclR family transcriptional regulator [Acidimicrobiales bacterium]|nr:IclR family transcriptional regulator [Acidimicrobiales bacterium]
MGNTDDTEQRRSVLGRVDTILSAFDDSDQVLTLQDLTDRSGLPKSTVHRMIEQLVGMGWLERDFDGYRVGMRLFEIGGLATRRRRLTESATPHLHALSTSTGFAVQLGVLDGDEVIYLHRVTAGDFDLPTRDGGRKPAYCTGLGKAMLAFDPEAAAEVLAGDLPRRTACTLTTPDALAAELDVIARTGVAHDREEAYEGLTCVAAPLRSTGRAIAAVSVTGPTDRFDADLVAPMVVQTAAAIWAERFPRR